MFRNSLYTDLYQLTMGQAFFNEGSHNRPASYSMFFRKLPFRGGFAIFCGSDTLLEMLRDYSFSDDDIEYLKEQRDVNNKQLFSDDYLKFLKNLRLELDVYAPSEGNLVFPYEPSLRVSGPILQCQLVETLLLNCINFQTLAATKAARIKLAAKNKVISEFGLRRAQGTGSMWAAKASYIGGFDSTSNVLAGREYGIPISGTHAHSWIMAHDSELEAFRKYVEVFPGNATLLIDTYSVEQGLDNAIIVAQEMEKRGERLFAVRIDSGDLTWQSRLAREELDKCGLDYVKIVLSNDLDEYKISSILEEGAQVDAFGVGTKFVCCEGQPNLGGVYKLNAYQDSQGNWIDAMKLSEQPEKTTIPGILNVLRYTDENGYLAGDMIFDEREKDLSEIIVDPLSTFKQKRLVGENPSILLHPIMKSGKRLKSWSIDDSRQNAVRALSQIDYTHKRNIYPHLYPVGIEEGLYLKREQMILEARCSK